MSKPPPGYPRPSSSDTDWMGGGGDARPGDYTPPSLTELRGSLERALSAVERVESAIQGAGTTEDDDHTELIEHLEDSAQGPEAGMSGHHYYGNQVNMGWKCPKCDRVYAPYVPECLKCNQGELDLEAATLDNRYLTPDSEDPNQETT